MLRIAALSWGDPWTLGDTVRVVGILVSAVVVTLVARVLVRRFERRLHTGGSQDLNVQRIGTLTHAVSTAAVVGIWTIAFLLLLENLGVELGPLLASAGVAGVALGFGAQSIVRDGLSGFFILLENQFGVGDVVDVQTASGQVGGRVESLTFRVTMLRAYDGRLHVVPNGNIVFLSNKSRGWARAIVDVRVSNGEELRRVREVLDELFEELRHDPAIRDGLMNGPSVLGVDTLPDLGQVVRVVVDTRPAKRFDIERTLRERIATRMAERGIDVPLAPSTMQTPQG
jgi:small conductance mechanosensitive channel